MESGFQIIEALDLPGSIMELFEIYFYNNHFDGYFLGFSDRVFKGLQRFTQLGPLTETLMETFLI